MRLSLKIDLLAFPSGRPSGPQHDIELRVVTTSERDSASVSMLVISATNCERAACHLKAPRIWKLRKGDALPPCDKLAAEQSTDLNCMATTAHVKSAGQTRAPTPFDYLVIAPEPLVPVLLSAANFLMMLAGQSTCAIT